jgi:hypothetical protein
MSTRPERGFAMVMALGVIVLLLSVLAYAIAYSQQDRVHTGKSVHNATVQGLTESTLQFGRSFYTLNYPFWPTYLSYFLTPRTAAQVKTDHPELVPPLPAGVGFDCYVYARDDVDELPPAANNPAVDNNLQIFIGAVCVQSGAANPLQSELIAALELDPSSALCQTQFGGGTQGLNNCSTAAGYR